jgi:hypothetical protein
MSFSNLIPSGGVGADISVDTITSTGGISVLSGSNITMSGGRITGLGAPSTNTDATTKLYVDNAVATGGGSFLPLSGGTMTGAINMGSQSLTALPAPSASTDATTKQYVDTSVSTSFSSCLPLAGGTMTGQLSMGGFQKIVDVATPTNSADVATKQNVDTAVATGGGSYLPLSGGTMSGVINMGSQKITALATPTTATDATTKQYVDTAVATGGGSYLPLSGGTLTGALTVGNNSALSVAGVSYLNGGALLGGAKITGLGAPSANTDATNKQYVDTAIATGGGAYVPLAGGSMTGTLAVQPATVVPNLLLQPAIGSAPATAQIVFSPSATQALLTSQASGNNATMQLSIPAVGTSIEMGGSGGGFIDMNANSVGLNTSEFEVAIGQPLVCNIGADKNVQPDGNIINLLGGRVNFGFGSLRPSQDQAAVSGMPFIQIRDSNYGDGTYLNLWYIRQNSADPTSGGLAIKSSGSAQYAIVWRGGVNTYEY